MIEGNETEISPRNQKIVKFYEAKLKIDPDKAIEKTMKHFNIQKTHTRNIINKYSEYPTPTAYKRMLQDTTAVSSIIADGVIDKEFSEEYGGLITSGAIERVVKSAEQMGLDVKKGFAEYLKYIIHNEIKEVTGDTLVSLKSDIPLRKTLKQQVQERKAEAELMEAEKRIIRAKTDIKAEEGSFHLINEDVISMKDEEVPIDEEFGDLYYNENYEEMFNDFMSIYFYLKRPNHDKHYTAQLIEQFGLKWAFKRAQAEEVRVFKVKEKQKELEKKQRELDIKEQKELAEYVEYLNGLPIEALSKINSGESDV